MSMEPPSDEFTPLSATLEQAERLQSLSVEILGILNAESTLSVAIGHIVSTVKSSLGFDAVALRLRKDDDYPYFCQEGLRSEFLLDESSLVLRNRDGEICRDERGDSRLDCLCGLVISGKADPTNPATTLGGSFWIGHGERSPGFDGAWEALGASARGSCLAQGFQSMALVPIRANQRTIGLLQIADRKPGRVTLRLVQFFEGICAGVGVALARKQADDRLKLLTVTIDAASDGVYWIDMDGRFIYVNSSGCSMLGYRHDELLAMRISDVNPLVTPQGWVSISQSIKEKKYFTTESVHRRKDGSEFPVEIVSAYVVIDGAEYINGLARDITERRRIQDALLKNEERYRLLFANMTEGFALHEVICDAAGNPTNYRYLDVNPAFERITGIKAEDAIGRTARELFPNMDSARIVLRGKVALTGEPFEQEGYDEMLRRYCRVVVFCPQLGHFATLYEDTTARNMAEQALRAQHAELERFTYAVSHDLKSPLVTIQTFLGYLEQSIQAGDLTGVGKDIDFIRNASNKMCLLLDELLKLSRIGRVMNPPAELSLVAVVNDALSLVAGRFAARRISVEVTSVPIVLRGDPPRLVELFQNLLDNAAKFIGDQPEPRVQIEAEVSNDEIVMVVRDNGIGFEPKHRDRLFGLFDRLDPNAEGTGLGLTLVRRIVQIHGGKIWAESDGPGLGAVFKFTLAGTRRIQDGSECHEQGRASGHPVGGG